MDYGLQLGRRFRALKLWFVLRQFGAEGIREKLRGAHRARAIVRGVGRRRIRLGSARAASALGGLFSLSRALAPEALDGFNERLMHAVNATGDIFISHTSIDGVFALRLAIGNLRTGPADVAYAWELLRRTAVTNGKTLD